MSCAEDDFVKRSKVCAANAHIKITFYCFKNKMILLFTSYTALQTLKSKKKLWKTIAAKLILVKLSNPKHKNRIKIGILSSAWMEVR